MYTYEIYSAGANRVLAEKPIMKPANFAQAETCARLLSESASDIFCIFARQESDLILISQWEAGVEIKKYDSPQHIPGEIAFDIPVQAWIGKHNHAPMQFHTGIMDLNTDDGRNVLTVSCWINGIMQVTVYDPAVESLSHVATYLVPIAPLVNEICKRHGIDYQYEKVLFDIGNSPKVTSKE